LKSSSSLERSCSSVIWRTSASLPTSMASTTRRATTVLSIQSLMSTGWSASTASAACHSPFRSHKS